MTATPETDLLDDAKRVYQGAKERLWNETSTGSLAALIAIAEELRKMNLRQDVALATNQVVDVFNNLLGGGQ